METILHENGKYRLFADYDKYEKDGDVHWQWYNQPGHEYKDLLDFALSPLLNLPQDKISTIVDVGCGDGLALSKLFERGFEGTGVDSSEKGIEIALMQHDVSAEYFIEKAEKFAKRGMEFDYLFSMNTIEHLDDPKALVEIMRHIKKFGIIVTDDARLSDPNKQIYHRRELTEEEFLNLFEEFHVVRLGPINNKYMVFQIFSKDEYNDH